MATFTGDRTVRVMIGTASEICFVIGGGDEPTPCTEDGPRLGFLAGSEDRDFRTRKLAPFLSEVEEGGKGDEGREERSHGVAEGINPWQGVTAGESGVPGVTRFLHAEGHRRELQPLEEAQAAACEATPESECWRSVQHPPTERRIL